MNRTARLAGLFLLLSMAASLGLAGVYIAGGQPQAEGALLAVSLGSIGAALILWGKRILEGPNDVEPREPPSPPAEVEEAEEAVEEGAERIARRRFLVRLLGAAGGALGVALVFPIRSLGPSPGDSLLVTQWKRGARLVTRTGDPLLATSLESGSIVTVFPEGFIGSADSQAVLVRVDAANLDLPAGRGSWAPEGNLCYSKVCTHAGCPVGLYIQTEHALRCPCHQSTFDVYTGAEPISGPAVRPLPQLALEVDAEGYLVAGGDFSGPVGPSFWNMP
ncbi:MAG: Rieske 2Fe-2S domain-containing protein [Actinomycetota bacterium]